MVDSRRAAATDTGPNDREKAVQFVATQAAIEAVDRALKDEKEAAAKGQYSRESR